MKSKLLIVDDDSNILSMLKRVLTHEGYEIYTASNGEEALRVLEQVKPDLVLLDVMMPVKNGWEVCAEIRKLDQGLPILMLTAKDEVENRVKGLDIGADDYIIKPFILEELLARVRAHIRRQIQKKEGRNNLRYADLLLNLESRRAWRGERSLELKGKEVELLAVFMQNPQQVLPKDTLIERVWGFDYEQESNVIEVYIASLRQKLEENGEKRIILTVRGVGYVLRSE